MNKNLKWLLTCWYYYVFTIIYILYDLAYHVDFKRGLVYILSTIIFTFVFIGLTFLLFRFGFLKINEFLKNKK